MGSEEAKQLIDLAFKAYLSDYREGHDELTFLNFVFIHLATQARDEYKPLIEALKKLGAGNITDAIEQAAKKL